ncbi:MAG: hypothetical protein JRC87_08930 [Deltaproteobacteria bacterium]|nr:hypothetical protein [Deltaproteobacteria bacterium]MBW2659691.1 hypothetical protein [Deltaproteobacteria bacterium]
MKYDVTVFTPCSFKTGQKIRIEGGRRKGDWEVVAVGEHMVTLRCPVSKKEYEWPFFCYFTEEKKEEEWPQGS